MPPEDKEVKEEEPKEKEALAPAEAKQTEEKKEHMIPKSRLDEEIKKRKESDKMLAALQKEKASETEKHLEEQGKYKELAEKRATELAELQPRADQVDSMAKTLKEILAAEIEALPEAARGLVPSKYSDQQQLDWIAEHKADLSKPNAFDIGAGIRGSENGEVLIELSAEEKAMASDFGMSTKEYAEHKDKE